MKMDVTQIQNHLPHRYPFLLVDRVLELERYKRIVAIKNVTRNENFFNGHFPGNPIMPGVLIIEALAQTAGIMMLDEFEYKEKVILFVGMNKVRFKSKVVPGDVLRLEVTTVRESKKLGIFEGQAFVGETLAASGEFMALVQERSQL